MPLRVFPGYYQQFRGEYIIPLDPGSPEGVLSQLGFIKERSTDIHGDVDGEGDEEGKGTRAGVEVGQDRIEQRIRIHSLC